MRFSLPFLALLLLTTLPALGDIGAEEIPEENSSTVSEDARVLRDTFDAVDQAVAGGDWNTAVRQLQTIIDAERDPKAPRQATAWVLPVRGRSVYEGAWIVARHRIARGGAEALAAYAAEYGRTATDLLRDASAARDPDGLAYVAQHYLPLPSARTAVLALADLALEAGDRDGALGWLDRLADVEAVSTEGAKAWAPWRRARQARAAAAQARAGAMEAVQAHLLRADGEAAPPEERFAPIPAPLRARPEPIRGWPMRGGRAARDAVAPALGEQFQLAWFNSLESGRIPDEPSAVQLRDRPSTWHPTGCVTDGRTAFAFDGKKLYAFDVKSGRRRAAPFPVASASGDALYRFRDPDREPRDELGLLQSHTLTLGPMTSTGRLIYVAAPHPNASVGGWSYEEGRHDRLVAVVYDGMAFEQVFDVGGMSWDELGQTTDTRLYGSPVLYRGRLWIAAIRPTPSATDQAEAWLLALEPRTGKIEIETYLGLGPPVRRGRVDEAIPTSPAAARGRVVVGTSLGIVAAVDADDGRPQWLLRYERGAVAQGRSRRLGSLRDTAPRLSGFRNQPPVLALERTFVAPTDGPHLLCLFDRPRGAGRELVSWRLHRRLDFRDFAAEQIVAAQDGDGSHPPRLILAGKGRSTEGDVPAPIAVALDALRPPRVLWTATATTGDGGEPYGRAVATDAELFVPTRHGISVYSTVDGRDRATLDVSNLPDEWASLLPTDVGPYGNLIAVPGKGLLAVNESLVAFWRR